MTKIDWNEIDWTLRNFEIMEQTGSSYATVSRERVKSGNKGKFRRGQIGKPKRPGSSSAATLDPEKIDWSRSYSSIGREYGVTRQAAQNMHKRYQEFLATQ